MVSEYLTDIAKAVYSHPEYAAPVFALLSAYFLYGLLGKRLLGADDDFWERIRAYLIPKMAKFTDLTAAGYVYTDALPREYAGKVKMTEEEFERALKDAGYLRQPVASLHRRRGEEVEDGSWARTFGPLYFGEAFAEWFTTGRIRVPFFAEYTRRFLKSLDTIFALKQVHEFHYVTTDAGGNEWVGVYGHTEYNPLNPFTALRHYRAHDFAASPRQVRTDLAEVGVELETGE